MEKVELPENAPRSTTPQKFYKTVYYPPISLFLLFATLRRLSTMKIGGLWKKFPVHYVFGANTDVGKTIFSTALLRHLANENSLYIKPISTGDLNEADDGHVNRYVSQINSHCLSQLSTPCSPHLALQLESKVRDTTEEPHVNDQVVLSKLNDTLHSHISKVRTGYGLIETAGGVLSPTLNGSLQADLYRSMRFPAILVGDARLGGLSATISSLESLKSRGFDVDAIAMFTSPDDPYKNAEYLPQYLKGVLGETKVISIPSSLPPPRGLDTDIRDELEMMDNYYFRLTDSGAFGEIQEIIDTNHAERVSTLDSIPERALSSVWYPFSQHREITRDTITTIDSAYGDFFATAKPNEESMLRPSFDGSASWWTQSLGHGDHQLAQTAAYAAGRYGHVIFANTAHEPAVKLAETILDYSQNPRLSKCFYTDNGSTGTEVAVKMALNAYIKRKKSESSKPREIGILGLKGSYHGDTIGCLDMSEPSIYNEKVPWYTGRGHWLDYPTVAMRDGKWTVSVPESLKSELGCCEQSFDSLTDVFAIRNNKKYREYIEKEVKRLLDSGREFGAVMMEPVILGAGGMNLVDPEFQRALVDVARNSDIFKETHVDSDTTWSGLPVIYDEVFTGLYRLGTFTAAQLLQVFPDISVHAKILTGGILPMSVTLASESIYDSFLSDSKADALLHGHSYTAHPIGCSVAINTLGRLKTMEQDSEGPWAPFKQDWKSSKVTETWSCWSEDLLNHVSASEKISGAFAIGSVLAITFKDESGGGYASTASVELQKYLAKGQGADDWNVHARVLGNVLYLMASQSSKPQELEAIQQRVRTYFQ